VLKVIIEASVSRDAECLDEGLRLMRVVCTLFITELHDIPS
jgi:hypothetical protein